jgi:hypothetical protein
MYATTYSSPVREGLVQGFRCPVSGREFVTCNPSKAETEALFRKQQEFSGALYYEQDGGNPILRTVESRRQQYVAEHGAI